MSIKDEIIQIHKQTESIKQATKEIGGKSKHDEWKEHAKEEASKALHEALERGCDGGDLFDLIYNDGVPYIGVFGWLGEWV